MKLLMPFDCVEPEFVRGFEAGRVWAMIDKIVEEGEYLPTEPITVHATNAEMMIRIAEAHDVAVRSVEIDDTWIEVTFGVYD